MYYPLTYPQKAIWDICRFFPDTTIAVNNASARIVVNELDYNTLEQAINLSIAYYDALRIRIVTSDNQPVQHIEEYRYRSFPLVDFSKKDISVFYQWEENTTQIPIAPTDFPLHNFFMFRINDNEGGFLLKLHHLISDGWSMALVIKLCLRYYTALCRNESIVPPSRTSYIDFIHREEKYTCSRRFIKDQNYWHNKLLSFMPQSYCITRPAVIAGTQSSRSSFIIPGDLSSRVNSFCRKLRISVPSFFLSVTAVYLSRFYNTSDLTLGTSVLNRVNIREKETVGMFINMIPVHLKIVKGMTFTSLTKRNWQTWRECLKHQQYPFGLILEEFRKLHAQSDRLYDITFSFQNSLIQDSGQPGVSTRWHAYRHQPEALNIHVSDRDQEGIYIFNLDYLIDHFSENDMRRMSQNMIHLIDFVIGNPDTVLDAIEIVSEQQRQQLLFSFNATAVPISDNRAIHELIECRTDTSPANTAVVSGGTSLNYAELDIAANRTAHFLISCNEDRTTPVAILMTNTPDQATAILGILKSGTSYLPLDPKFPPDRIKSIINDAHVHTLISQKRFLKTLNRLLWECPSLNRYLCCDSDTVLSEDEIECNSLMNRELWEFVGESSVDAITGGGWNSSYTGRPISQNEMDEYGNNILQKLKPFIHAETRVLEIGCGSGISMFLLAPLVACYHGTDISRNIIERNRRIMTEKQIVNIQLSVLPAHNIITIKAPPFDIVILNSVIQCFNGHNYLRKVIRSAVEMLNTHGIIFIGDIMDPDCREEMIADLSDYKHNRAAPGDRTKTSWDNELFISREFLEDLRCDIPSIAGIDFTDKIGSIENELTRFRYDAVLTIDKSVQSTPPLRRKCAYDTNILAIQADTRTAITVAPEDTAYVIYTSGTTGSPKGTQIPHSALVNLCSWHNRHYLVTESDRATRYAGSGFDASVWELFPYLIAGASVHYIDEKIRYSIDTLSNYFTKAGITISFLPTQLCEQFIRKEHPTLRALLTGGDRLNSWLPTTYALHNNYGPTEYAVVATSFHIDREYTTIPIGKPIDNTRIYIIDEHNNLQPIGAPGEICIAGDGLAKGYLNRPDLTSVKFVDNPFETGSRMYRTGDIGKWTDDGTIAFIGRGDLQVKLRGYRIELNEIEQSLLRIDQIQEAVVVKRDDARSAEFLCAYIVSDTTCTLEIIQDELRRTLPDYMIPTRLVILERMPLSASGKIDRRTLPAPDHVASSVFSPPQTETEKELAMAWEEVLGTGPVGINDNFFDLGGDSIRAIEIASRMKRHALKFDIRDLFIHPTIAGLSGFMQKSQPVACDQKSIATNPFTSLLSAEIEQVHKTAAGLSENSSQSGAVPSIESVYHLSPMQEGMLYHSTLDRQAYFEDLRFEWKGALNIRIMRRAFRKLIKRNDIFRTVFIHEGVRRPLQIVVSNRNCNLLFRDLSDIGADEQLLMINTECAKSRDLGFTLSTDVPIRLFFFMTATLTYTCVLHFHHIILDGWSLSIVLKELVDIYTSISAQKTTDLPVRRSYRDYIVWIDATDKAESIRYWTDYLSKCKNPTIIPHSFLHYDSGFQFGMYETIIDECTTATLTRIAKSSNLTSGALCAGIWSVVLQRYNNRDSVSFGIVVSGRNAHLDGIDQMVGLFINTIPLVVSADGTTSFIDMCHRLQSDLRNSEPHSQISPAKIRQLSPLKEHTINHIFSFENYRMEKDVSALLNKNHSSGIAIDKISLSEQITFPFSVKVLPDNELTVQFTYDVRMYSREFIQNIANHIHQTILILIRNPHIPVEDIDILTSVERERIVRRFNKSGRDFCTKPLHMLFEDRARETPQSTAIISEDGPLSYHELNSRSDRFACLLRNKGTGPESVVAILAEKPSLYPVPILATLKAGGAFLCIDPSFPEARIRYLLTDSNASVLVTQKKFRKKINLNITTFDIDGRYQVPDSNDNNSILSKNSAYIIYTSGTTGKPKGVVVEHGQIANQILGFIDRFNISNRFNHILLARFSFDVSIQQLFVPLCSGGRLFIPSESIMQNPVALADFIRKNRITLLNSVPVFIRLLAQSIRQPIYVKYLLIGGDIFTKDLYEEIRKTINAECVFNIYGPTETTINATVHECLPEEPGNTIPIGKPLFNYRVYILDSSFRPVPIGIPGELYIGGEGVGRGYLNQPELTHSCFPPDVMDPGNRMYRSGDRARWTENGELEFLGREDAQIKIRGFRIEPGEIECSLRQHPSVENAAVIVHPVSSGTSILSAFIVESTPVQTEEIREFLAQLLPKYMVPSSINPIAHLPLTSHGKIDKQSLIKIAENNLSGRQAQFNPPETEVEVVLIRIWQQLLTHNNFSVTDSFLKAGGDSLRFMRMASRIREEFTIQVPVTELVRRATVRSIAELIENERVHTSNDRQLVVIRRSQNSNRNIFFIHAGNGTIESYIPLCENLSGDFTCWGICSEPYNEYPLNKPDIESIAGRYIELISAVQQDGPFILIGWCIGGTIAFEMARQLEQKARALSALILISTLGPGVYAKELRNRATAEILKPWAERLLLRNVQNTDELGDDIWRKAITMINDRTVVLRDVKNEVRKPIGRSIPDFEQLSAPELTGFMNRIKVYSDIRADYIPKTVLTVPVHFISAAETPEINITNWQPFCRNRIKVHKIDGDHYSIFSRSNVQLLAEAIDQALISECTTTTTQNHS